MEKIEAKKDGKGNIIISEDSFEMLLACLDNQKFVGEQPQNGDSLSVGEDDYWKGQEDIQKAIDHYNRECRKILHQKYVFDTTHNGLSLYKKYEHQTENTEWSGVDVGLVYEIFKNTVIKYNETKKDGKSNEDGEDGWFPVKSEPTPWLIERPLRYDNEYLTISEDGQNNRPWKKEEIEKISNLFNNN